MTETTVAPNLTVDAYVMPPVISGLMSVPASVIILMTIFGNLLVLCFKARVGRTNTTLLVWNLGLTDFLVGVIVLPLGAVHLIFRKWMFGAFLCRLWVAADVTFCTCSVVTICVISVDRYMAVTRPLRYKCIVTKARVIIVMIIIWSFSLMIPVATWKWNDLDLTDEKEKMCFVGDQIRYLAHSVVLAFFLPASVTLSLYWRIYNLARKRQKALDRGFLMILGHNMNFLTNTISQQTTLRVHFGRKNGMVEHQRRVLRTHERIAKTLGVVSCSFLFCWLPFFSLYLTNFKCDGCVHPIAIDIASWLGYCNSMLNPIIYSFTVKEFKKSAQRMMLPLWTLAHRILPFISPPPDGLNLKMSRHGKNRKSRPHSFVELGKNKSGVLTSRVTRQRRQTEPAVFASLEDRKRLGKVAAAKDAEAMPTTIIEEDDEVIYSEVNSLTSSFSSTFSESRFVSPRKKSSFTRMPTLTEKQSLELTTSNGVSASSGGPSEHSIRMHYDTIEADV